MLAQETRVTFAVTYTQSSLQQVPPARRSPISEEALQTLQQLNTLDPVSSNDRKVSAILLAGEALRYQLKLKSNGQRPLSFDLAVHRKVIRQDIEILMQDPEVRTPRHYKPPNAEKEKDNYFFIKTELAGLRLWDIPPKERHRNRHKM